MASPWFFPAGYSKTRRRGRQASDDGVFSDPGSGYILIERNEREMVFGGLGRVVSNAEKPVLSSPAAFASFDQSGCVKVAFNLKVDDSGNGWSAVSTETRLHGLDAGSRRGMAVYWRLIYPGSGMLRTMWLQAARTRVEKAQ